jgi:hypothetical protein
VLGLSLSTSAAAKDFASRLHACLVTLNGLYPSLLEEIEERVRQAFAITLEVPDAWGELQARVSPLRAFATERRLKLFVSEILNTARGGDWRETIGRAVRAGVPPNTWSDTDLAEFSVEINSLAVECARLALMVRSKEVHGAQQVIRIDVLNEFNAGEEPIVLALSEEASHRAKDIAIAIGKVLERELGVASVDRYELELAALANAAFAIARARALLEQ